VHRFERWLLTAVLLLIAGSLNLYYWRLNQPMFVRTPFTEAEQEIMVAVSGDTIARFRINQRLLSNAQPRYAIDHYQWGEFVDQTPKGGGVPFYQMEPKNRLTDVYIGFSQESKVAPGSMHIGFEETGIGQRFSVPQHDYVHFATPVRVPFEVDEPMLMALVVFSDKPIDVDALSGKGGQSLLEAASQYPDVFVYTLQFVQETEK